MASSKVVIAPARRLHFTGGFMPPTKLRPVLSILTPRTWLHRRSLVYGANVSLRPSLLTLMMKVRRNATRKYHRPGDPAVGEIVTQIIK